MKIECAELSAVGDREDNQDRAAIVAADEAVLLLVFDGMGGHSDGALAAETGLKAIQSRFSAIDPPLLDPQGFLYTALAAAHEEVVQLGAELAVEFRPRATCALCLVQDGGSFWAHVGDSRIYHLRGDRILARSLDHSHVEILIQEGAISAEEALDHPLRNFVESCIGGDDAVPDMTIAGHKPLQPGDVLLVCTDGMWSGVAEDEIASMATRNGASLAENLKAINVKALRNNAPYSDNSTATALRWIGI